MARYLNDVDEFKKFIFRKLGSPVHEIEIDSLQFEDILNDSIDEFRDYSDAGSIERIVTIDPQGQTEFTLDSSVLAINGCYSISEYTNIADLAYPSSSMYSQLIQNATNEQQLSSYVITKQYYSMFQDLFNTIIVYKFNSETKTLILGQAYKSPIAFTCLIAEDFNKYLNNKFFKMLVEEKCLRQWAKNIGLKYNTSNSSIIGNGLSLNPQQMLDDANELRERIETGIEGDEWGSLLMPRRLYD